MSHSKEINETSIRQLQITYVELKLYSDACSELTKDDKKLGTESGNTLRCCSALDLIFCPKRTPCENPTLDKVELRGCATSSFLLYDTELVLGVDNLYPKKEQLIDVESSKLQKKS
jgi:hypothetical protein